MARRAKVADRLVEEDDLGAVRQRRPWQTLANAADYFSADNVPPNVPGCAYLASRLATSMRAEILAL